MDLSQRQPREPATKIHCKIGCGGLFERKRLPKHYEAKHYRCTTCDKIFLLNDWKKHTFSTAGHAHCEELLRPDQKEPDATSLDLNAKVYWRYHKMIDHLLKECREAKQHCLSNNTRWYHSLASLERLFPSDGRIPFARIRTISDLLLDGDVWYVTEDELTHLLDGNLQLSKPIVIRPDRLMPASDGPGELSATLKDHFKDGTVDVQDMSTEDKDPIKMSVDEVIGRIRTGSDFSSGRLPVNLLNLKFLGQIPPGPAFLNRRRFGLIPAINSRLEAQWKGEAVAGKRSHAAMLGTREVDLFASTTFSLFGQRGSFTGFHVDNPDGTWVRNIWGLKVWIFPANWTATEREVFEEEGDDWIPQAVKIIVLEPGDILVMPPGEIVPHAVLTLADSHMVGGMFLDTNRVLDMVEKVLWITKNPSVTNEAIPLQLLRGWDHLRDLFMESEPSEVERTRFGELSRTLRGELSCSCTGPCETRCISCKCASSAAQDRTCTSWCHATQPASRRRKTAKGKRDPREQNA